MIKINRKVEYGLIALKYMMGKPSGELTSVREICETFGAPFDPMAHVMRIMNTNGLVQSEQGARGGYRLVGDVMEIAFGDFIEMIEDQPLAFATCVLENDERCNLQDCCNIISPIHHFHDRLMEFMRSVSLGDLMEKRIPPPFAQTMPDSYAAI